MLSVLGSEMLPRGGWEVGLRVRAGRINTTLRVREKASAENGQEAM